jgi:tetratricopeptide (TPR) repeat protein
VLLRWPLVAILALAAILARAETAAVLPFWNQADPTTAGKLDWIGESIAEMVRDALSAHGVLGFDRTEIEDALHRLRLRDRVALSQASVIKLGEELDAEHVLFGNFQFTPTPTPGASAGSLKISARILDRKRMRLGPEFVETGALEDLGTIEAHLAWRALMQLAPNAAPPESDFRTLRPPIRLDAEENYVRGILAQDPTQKEKFFLQAARLDARFAHPCYALGQIHYQRKEYRQAAEWLEKIPPDDIHFRAASFLLGLARFYSGDFPGAQKAFQTIVETVPLGEVYNNLGASESRRNLPQAIDDFRRAAGGDPSDSVYQFNLGYALWKKGDFVEAADHFRELLNRDPEDSVATLLLGRCLKKQGLHIGTAGTAHDADARLTGIERLKTNYDERAYRQLKAVLDPRP